MFNKNKLNRSVNSFFLGTLFLVTIGFAPLQFAQFPFTTIWAVNDDVDGVLQYYTLELNNNFLNVEGNIEGVQGPKDIEDLIIDEDGNFFFVNNVGTSTIYRFHSSELDGDENTPVPATLVGSTGLTAGPDDSSPDEISSLLFYNDVLYGLGLASKKLYSISKVDGSLTQVATLSVAGDFRSDGMTIREGIVYLLKTNDTGGESEIWKFDQFPGSSISYVRHIELSGKVEALTAHPDGFLYASDENRLYQISVTNSDIAYLADYSVDIEGMDFFGSTTVIVGEDILLSPLTATNPVGTPHTVTATVQNEFGDPIVGRAVDFEIVNGPNVGLTGSDITDANGEATFTYTSSIVGVDEIVAEMLNTQGNLVPSNSVIKEWTTSEVTIDIKPQSCPNPFNVKKKGVMPVAILGTGDFDVLNIDPATVLFEGVAPIRWAIEDVTTPVAGGEQCDCTTDGPDGFDDLTLKFDAQELVAALGSVNNGNELVLTITGSLLDGTPIEGSDCVIIKAKNLGKHLAGNSSNVPEEYALFENFPNPFNPSTTIQFAVPEQSFVKLDIYNSLGEKVTTLVSEELEAGTYSFNWDATNLPSGVYIYSIQSRDFFESKKMILMK